MTDYELKALDTLDTPSYLNGILSDDGKPPAARLSHSCHDSDTDIVLPADMIPPNPDEHDSE